MRHLRRGKTPVVILLALLLLVAVIPADLCAKETICKTAFERCFIDAIIAGVFGGIEAGIGYGAWCSAGYAWCLKYVE